MSILSIKESKIGHSDNLLLDFIYVLTTQLGMEKYGQITSSNEYKDLKAANLAVFEGVERARYGEISAKEIDDLNMIRHKAKATLQARFWSTQLTEQKS